MLSERVLDELVRQSELSEVLSKALWPDLSIESKLQLISALHAGFSPITPDWLVDLALEDSSPVVQYFSLRHANLRSRRDGIPEEFSGLLEVSDEDAARYAKAYSIHHPLVEAAVANFSFSSDREKFLHASQMERLAWARNNGQVSFGSFMELLEDVIEDVDDRELAAVAYEYFLRPDTQRELQRGRLGFPDGESAYFAGQGLLQGWKLVRSAGPALINVLVASLPTSLGLGTIEASELATMPERVLCLLAYDNRDRQEVNDLHQMMRENPDRFPQKAVKELEGVAEYRRIESDELRRERWLESPLIERTTLEAILALQQQLTSIAGQIQDLRESPPKRGFFG